MRRAGPEGGFTLMEVLISLVVMVIGLAGVMMMQATAARANRNSARYTKAALYAQEIMEQLRGRTVASLEGPPPMTVPDTTLNGVFYDAEFQLSPVAGAPNLVLLKVSVSYRDDGDTTAAGAHTATVQMIRTRLEGL